MGNCNSNSRDTTITHTCGKCESLYVPTHGIYSINKNCQKHYWINGLCIHCNTTNNFSLYCYHRKKNWKNWFF